MTKILWEERSFDERSEAIGHAIVPIVSHARIAAHLELAYRLFGTKHQGQLYSVVGDSHVGKSSAVDTFMTQKARQISGEFLNVDGKAEGLEEVPYVKYVTHFDGKSIITPIVKIQLGENPTFRGLANDTLRALLRGAPPKWNDYGDLSRIFQRQLLGQGTRVLIYDDAQDMGLVRGVAKANAVNLLKLLCKVARVEVVLVGTPDTDELIAVDNQLKRLNKGCRLFVPHLDKPTESDEEKAAKRKGKQVDIAKLDEFRRALMNLERNLPFDLPSNLSEISMAERLWKYSDNGVIGAVKNLLQTATGIAMMMPGQRNLDRALFEDIARGDWTPQANPFSLREGEFDPEDADNG